MKEQLNQSHNDYRIAVYPGSFDPVTLGHLDIIYRAAKQYDRVVVSVLNNGTKTPLFSVKERKKLLTEVTANLPNVEIDSFQGLLVKYMPSKKANVILRGIRTVSDFEFELQMASTNCALDESIETVFMMTNPKYSYLSSSMVKEIAKFNGSVQDLVSPAVEQALRKKYNLQ